MTPAEARCSKRRNELRDIVIRVDDFAMDFGLSQRQPVPHKAAAWELPARKAMTDSNVSVIALNVLNKHWIDQRRGTVAFSTCVCGGWGAHALSQGEGRPGAVRRE